MQFRRGGARGRATRILAALAVAAVALVVPAGTAGAAIDTTASALQLAQAMASDPTVITGATFVAKPPNGTPTAVADTGTSLGGFPLNGTTYTILSTGNATSASNPQSSLASANNGGGPVRGNTDLDVVILKVDVNVPANANCATVGVFKFLSEEYPQYVGKAVNDAFVAELDSSTWTTSSNSISAPNNFAFDNNGHVVSVNSSGNGVPIPGEQVKFYAGSTYLGSATTDFDGVAAFQSIAHARAIIDEPGYEAVYDGAACYQPSSDDAPVALVLGNDVP